MTFTDLLDEYLEAKAELDSARHEAECDLALRTIDPYDGSSRDLQRPIPGEARYDAAKRNLNDLVDRFLRMERSVLARDLVQALPSGFP